MNKKKKMGRPRIPKNKAKGTLIGARFSPPEVKQITARVKRSKMNKSAWIRKTLLSGGTAKAMSQVMNENCREGIPFNCPEAQEKYDGKSALFTVQSDKGYISCKGIIRVHFCDEGIACIFIEYFGGVGQFGLPAGWKFALDQPLVASIRPATLAGSSTSADTDFVVDKPLPFHLR